MAIIHEMQLLSGPRWNDSS